MVRLSSSVTQNVSRAMEDKDHCDNNCLPWRAETDTNFAPSATTSVAPSIHVENSCSTERIFLLVLSVAANRIRLVNF